MSQKVTIREAARLLGKSIDTIRRAQRAAAEGDLRRQQELGVLNFEQQEIPGGHQWLVELPDSIGCGEGTQQPQAAHRPAQGALEREVELLRQMLEDTRQERDYWRDQARAMTTLLAQQQPKQLPPPEQPRAWWRFWGRPAAVTASGD